MELKKASLKDIKELKKICMDAYSLSFHNHWNEGGLKWYLDKEFSNARLRRDLRHKNTNYYIINSKEKTVGFAKTKNNSLPSLPSDDGVEIEKIYVLPEFKGMGIGKLTLNEIIKKAKEFGKKILFLSVLDTNNDAITFYEKFGFKFHSKTTLDIPYFKDELKGMNRMYMELKGEKPAVKNLKN
jgi:ribosomal protein S18 acetylase RimI-like enzyme